MYVITLVTIVYHSRLSSTYIIDTRIYTAKVYLVKTFVSVLINQLIINYCFILIFVFKKLIFMVPKYYYTV